MVELKPCPFCGGKAILDIRTKDRRWSTDYKVVANHDEDCVFQKLWWYYGYESEEETIEAWNRRTEK